MTRANGAVATEPVIGRSMPRKEDHRLLTGSAHFVDDLDRPDAVHAAVLRSSHAHARIARLDLAAARAMPGVTDAFCAQDLPLPLPEIPMRMYQRPGMERFLQTPLAHDVVRYSGEPVAVVVAESRYLAEDALSLVDVVYEELPAVVDPLEAIAPEASLLHATAETNLTADFTMERGDVEAAFADADLVVEERLRCQRHAAVPLETRGLLAEIELGTGRLVVWGAAKIVHINRRILAALLGWPEERIRFVEVDVGGGFGARGEFYPEDYLIPFAALRSGRPVAWVEDREEHLRATNHSREQVHDIAVALKSDGTLLGLRDVITFNTGAYVRTHGTVVSNMAGGLLPGPYRWNAHRIQVRHVVTNKTPAGTYRAPGRYEANFARERILDIAARRLGIDPVELRRRNLVTPADMPYETGTHTGDHPVIYDSGDFPLLLEKGIERFDYEGMRRWREEDAGPLRRRGLGFGYFVEKSGIARWEYARVTLRSDGRTVAHVGSASVGQGVETVLAQVCADALGVPYDDVIVAHGDTDEVADGMGSFGSRASMLAGAAVMNAAGSLRTRILELAAEELEAAPQDVDIVGDRVEVRGAPGHGLPLRELAELARPLPALDAGRAVGLSDEAYFDSEHMSFPYGLHCVAVEVDVETGAVDVHQYAITYDVGRALNPQLVEGQIVGGLGQGIGGALLEELAYDASGQLVSGSFMDYLLPTAMEVPPVDVQVTEDAPTPYGPLGAKGAGEGGTAAAGAAIANAVSDALEVEAVELPLTPERVLAMASTSARAQPGENDR